MLHGFDMIKRQSLFSIFIWMNEYFCSTLYISLVPISFNVSFRNFKVIFQVYIQEFCKYDIFFFY